MKRLNPSVRGVVGVLGACLLSTACIITGIDDDDDDGVGASDDSTVPAETGLPPGTTGGDETGTTGDPPGECTENLLLDPGFEGGTPSADWSESSSLFGTPICDVSCILEEGPAESYAGDWWVWIGGASEMDLMEGAEIASVSQSVTIDPDSAFLSFWFQIRSAAGTGNDVFTVTLDGETVFMATDAEMADYSSYTQIDIDVSPWADGGTYELVIGGEQLGPGRTSFYVDEVSLISCSEDPVGTDTGSDTGETEGQDTTAGTGDDTGTGTTGDTEGTDTGSTGDSGGSSSSGG